MSARSTLTCDSGSWAADRTCIGGGTGDARCFEKEQTRQSHCFGTFCRPYVYGTEAFMRDELKWQHLRCHSGAGPDVGASNMGTAETSNASTESTTDSCCSDADVLLRIDELNAQAEGDSVRVGLLAAR